MKNINNQLMLFLLILASINFSCKKFLEIGPPKNAATSDEMFANDAIATSAITGIYGRMTVSAAFSGSPNSISVLSGFSSDELRCHSAFLDVFYKNEIPPTNSTSDTHLWTTTYAYIYTSNAVLEGLKSSKKVSESTNRQLQGEAKFIRALCYFYLVNLFGEVPLNLTTDYRINEIAGKSSKETIYTQIIIDLIDAESLLSANYETVERVRPNKWAAKALLSRVYLYNEKWSLAAQKATEVINQKTMYTLVDDLDKVFLKNSMEAVWQLMPRAGGNTQEGGLFILTTTPTTVSLSPDLVLSFEAEDNRKNKWVKEYSNATGKYFYPFKYKIKSSTTVTEYSMVIRLAELYLIRAESMAKLMQLDIALQDINLIRKRAGMSTPLVGLSQTACLIEVEKQRRHELFSEYGHRWFDLKRTSKASAVLAPLKGVSWQDTDVLYPIPASEINRNPNVTQNLGY